MHFDPCAGGSAQPDLGGSEGGSDGLDQSEGLERNAIGLTEVLFQSITFMAPAVAVALSIGFATTSPWGSPHWRSCSH